MKKIHDDFLEPPQQQLNNLIEYYQAGRYVDAEKLSLSITQEFPKHQFAWKVLAVLLKRNGRINESLIVSKKSVQLDPQDAEAHNNLGVLLQEQGKLDEAEISHRKAIELKPEYAEAHNNLGNTLKKQDKLDGAEKCYKKVITLKPDYAKAHNNLGTLLKEQGRIKEAEASYAKAIALKPDYVQAHYNLGVLLQEVERLDEAETSYNHALALKPDFTDALQNKWMILFSQKRYEIALKVADLITSKGDRAFDLITLYALGRTDEIYKRIETQSNMDSENLDISAFAAFVAESEKKPTAYNFCPNPMDFIHVSNISSHIANSTEFITEVIGELNNIKTIWEPRGRTTRKGFVTDKKFNLFENSSVKIAQLKAIICDEIDAYHLKFQEETCSFIKKWPSEIFLHGWHVVLKKQGYNTAHIHPTGWLSGVIYLKVVPALEKNEGAIEFSLNGQYYQHKKSPYLIFQPKVGDIVFFPSSLFHRTIPFTTDTDRIIVSFDLMPDTAKH
ncbi:tetratricopeptide repeat protein [Pelagibacterales bacterium SAG-MED11]|nr:tetratricopeptide repeat protein [Pelagibacterales bacterium SAG-MED11]